MQKRWAAIILCLLCLITIAGFTACSNNKYVNMPESNSVAKTSQPEESKIKVYVTFDAMKEFVQAIGKDRVEIFAIIPPGTEPHDFEPKAQDLVGLGTANVFVYNGLGMDTWVDSAIRAANNPNLITVEASKDADVIQNMAETKEYGQYDPHVWLSLKGAELQVKNIKEALAQADALNREYYENNFNEYVSRIESLYNEFYEKFQSVQRKNFVTGHAAFAYLCRDFGLEQNSVEDTFAEGEPTAQQLSKLVEYCKENMVTTIFAEKMASPEISQTLANEVGAKVETVYTIESAEDNMTYLQRMEDNLSKIYESLK